MWVPGSFKTGLLSPTNTVIVLWNVFKCHFDKNGQRLNLTQLVLVRLSLNMMSAHSVWLKDWQRLTNSTTVTGREIPDRWRSDGNIVCLMFLKRWTPVEIELRAGLEFYCSSPYGNHHHLYGFWRWWTHPFDSETHLGQLNVSLLSLG